MDSQLKINPYYSVLVAGDVDLTRYDATKKVEPYVVYKYEERAKIKKEAMRYYEEFINNLDSNASDSMLKSMLSVKLQDIQEMTDEEYFEIATKDMTYDKETGDALTTINPNGKYVKIVEAIEKYAMPLNGKSFQCKVSELPEKKISDDIIEKYSEHWDYLMTCAPNIKNDNIRTYGNKETFISVMSEPFFYNAFVSEETGWLEQGDGDQIQWVLNFKERFIDKLPKNTVLKVYNFKRYHE